MPRGGYQKPDPRKAGPGGPGRFSKRSDGVMQPPDLDNPDMQYGDVQRLRQAMQAVPPAGGSSKLGERGGGGRLTGEPVEGGKLPPFLTELDSARPNEPITAGLDIGAGPGSEALMSPQAPPDVRERVLEYLYWTYENQDAYELLHQLREERAAKGDVSPIPQLPQRPAAAGPTRLQQETQEPEA